MALERNRTMDTTVPTGTYEDDTDFDEAFKNLLRPVESITRTKHFEPLRYNLLKELDSYLKHLRELECGLEVFVEASLMIQNVILIYQRRVDCLFDAMMKLNLKFRAYRINRNYDDLENGTECNQKKKKEKIVKFYSSFEPIEVKVSRTLKKFDCKTINLSKILPISKIVLNTNIKVNNKYTEILPYILVGNGENIGKKYDYMLSYPINRDLAVNEEFDCSSNENNIGTNLLNYRKNTNLSPVNLMDVDPQEIIPRIEDPAIFDEIVNDVSILVPHAGENPITDNIMDVSSIPAESGYNPWADLIIKDKKDDTFINKPITYKKQKSPEYEVNSFWLPTYTINDYNNNLSQIESITLVDPMLRLKYHKVIKAQRSEIAKIRRKQIIEKEKDQLNIDDEEMDEGLKNDAIADEPWVEGFDGDQVCDDNFNNNAVENVDEFEENYANNFQAYQNKVLEMQKLHEQYQLEIINEKLEMRKRVQAWHDTIRPILEEEEKFTAFDIHAYETRLLNSFSSVGEKHLFKELAGGLDQRETARYFLATLILVNTYNLKITKTTDGSRDEIVIELLKNERHHEELQLSIGNRVD